MAAKVACDAAGHYGRPDLFRLFVDGREVYPGGDAGEVPEAQPRSDERPSDLAGTAGL